MHFARGTLKCFLSGDYPLTKDAKSTTHVKYGYTTCLRRAFSIPCSHYHDKAAEENNLQQRARNHLNKINIQSLACLSYFFAELKIYHLPSFIITPDAFDNADPSSMQDAFHNDPVNMTLLATSLPSSSVVRASVRCKGGHGVDSRWRFRVFLCPTLVAR